MLKKASQGDAMDDETRDPNKDQQAARRAFLRAVAYTAPAVLTAVQINRAQAQAVSCGPSACPPGGNPCGPGSGGCGPGGGSCGPNNCPPNR